MLKRWTSFNELLQFVPTLKQFFWENFKKTGVSKDDPPVLTIYGDRDITVPPKQAELLDDKMKEVGASHDIARSDPIRLWFSDRWGKVYKFAKIKIYFLIIDPRSILKILLKSLKKSIYYSTLKILI